MDTPPFFPTQARHRALRPPHAQPSIVIYPSDQTWPQCVIPASPRGPLPVLGPHGTHCHCRICYSDTSSPQEDQYPPNIAVKVNHSYCSVPVSRFPRQLQICWVGGGQAWWEGQGQRPSVVAEPPSAPRATTPRISPEWNPKDPAAPSTSPTSCTCPQPPTESPSPGGTTAR